ncbi:MAG: flavin monoamine oxidase family protein, partial [Anaerolineales bacterium]
EAIDLGAQWVGPKQLNIMRLIRELGLHTFPQYNRGKKVVELDGRISHYRGSVPSLSLWNLLELQFNLARIERLCRQVPLADPLQSSRAAEWDAISVGEWTRRHIRSRHARTMIDLSVRGLFTVEPDELSFLHFLFYLHSGGGLSTLYEIDGGAQQARLMEGTQTLSLRLAERLVERGGRVILNAPVQAIAYDAESVTVQANDHDHDRAHTARYAIIAAPPLLAGQIDFQPALPKERQSLLDQMPMGSVIKCVAVYAQPFWRAAGYAGEMYSTASSLCFTFDDSPASNGFGALVAFFAGQAAREWSARSAEARRAVVLDEMARFFGPAAATPIDFVEQDWVADEWSRGCYSGIFAPRVISQHGYHLRETVGRLHWAGTETAHVGIGYLDGAVESGERAAEEVLRRLSLPV